jgi:hypothetical protein
VKAEEFDYMRWLVGHYQELARDYVAGKFDETKSDGGKFKFPEK